MIERVHGHDYRIKLTNRVKMFHANMHKKYTVRESEKEPELHEIAAVVVEEQLNVPGDQSKFMSALPNRRNIIVM